jgi:CMP-N-acetylneuraminic acid synthetase
MYYLKDGQRVRQVVPTKPGKPRQEFPEALWRNGAIYLVKTEVFMNEEKFITNDCVPYIMPPERSVNIDSKNDLMLAEYYLEKMEDRNKENREDKKVITV